MKAALKETLRKNCNVPNLLTLLRLLMIPLYLALFLHGLKYPALIIFLAASLTDLLDGMIARRYHLITDLGKLMDPLADKLMVVTALFCQAFSGIIPWVAVLVVLSKELLMVLGGAYMLKKGIVVYSNMVGKVAHCLFIAALVATFFHSALLAALPGWFMTPDLMLVWIAVIVTLCAMIVYGRSALNQLRAGKPEVSPKQS